MPNSKPAETDPRFEVEKLLFTKNSWPEEHRRWRSVVCTAWDSEIESLTSLIKLHQNERRSAPCGQIGAATQPPELAPSPTLKKFWVAAGERSKLDELARAVMIGRFIAFAIFSHFSFSLFYWRCGKHQYRGSSPVSRRHSHFKYCLSPATSGIDNAFDPATHWLPKWIQYCRVPKNGLPKNG